MTVTTRSLRAAFSLWVSLGLLAAAMPCAWVCSSATETPGATAAATPSEHCAKRAHATPAAPEAPIPPDTPCDEDCPGCAGSQVSIPSTALALDATSAPCSLSILAAHAHPTAFPPSAPAMRAPQWAGDLPPPDILALTTTLLI